MSQKEFFMNECSFFKSFTRNIESRIIHGDRQLNNISQVDAFYCSHPNHSPLTLKKAKKSIGDKKLQCEGNIENCILSDEKYFDL